MTFPAPRRRPLVILREEGDIVFYNKPPGLAVHGGARVKTNLVDLAREREGWEAAVPVHRLDRETSGIVMLARNGEAASRVYPRLDAGEKRYLVIAKGKKGSDRFSVDAPVEEDGRLRDARTHFKVICRMGPWNLLEALLETGRRHQIRIHLAQADRPIAGDGKYGDFPANRELRKKLGVEALYLHAWELRLPAMGPREKALHLRADWPPYFETFLKMYNAPWRPPTTRAPRSERPRSSPAPLEGSGTDETPKTTPDA